MAHARASGDIIRNAGNTTLVLQVLSGTLLFILVVLFVDISARFRQLQSGIRENAMWAVFQLDREARVLDYSLSEVLHQQVPPKEDYDRLALHYDILYSRALTIQTTHFGPYFSSDLTVTNLRNDIATRISGFVGMFDRYENGLTPGVQELRDLEAQLADLSRTTSQLLLYTNSRLSEERADSRAVVMELEKTSAVMLILLLASVMFLVVTLRRQLKSVREAGLTLEVMTQELGDAYEAADAGNRAKSQFMATMGHEIRTPLNAILGLAELLELSELPEDARASVRTIRTSGEALLEVINEILDYSKIEHGKLEIEERVVDVRNLAETTVAIIGRSADEHGNTVKLDIPATLHAPVVRSDPTRLRQVLLNLLSNAVKFTNDGTVILRLREFYRDNALMLRVEVEDTGIGIDESGLSKLFKPFSQVDASISRKYGGTGLGLTICKQIVEKLGGELGLSSTVGVGSIFWFELTVVAAENSELLMVPGDTSDLARGLPGLRILLVEDNRVNQEVATRFLEKLGQQVTVAVNGQIAVDLADAQDFDLVLMDMQMPVMDGIEATRMIRQRGGRNLVMPIVAMTANASDDDRLRCQTAGMVGFESKPVTMERLRNVIATFAVSPVRKPDATMKEEEMPVNDSVEALPDIDGLDVARHAELVEALGNDVFQELVESFFSDAEELLDQLKSAVAARKAEEIDRVLHTIKGAAVNVGLSDIAGSANALRRKEPSVDDISTLTGEIESMKFKLVA